MIPDFRSKLEGIVSYLKEEVFSLRTGRATPAMVENLEIDYYGAKTPLKVVASISSPEARQLVIQPWDKNVLPAIEKAIINSSLGMNPIADRDTIRLSVPALTEERRKDLVKILGRHMEDAKIKIRREREEALKEIDRKEKAKEMSEDEKFRQKNEIQKQIDEINKKMEDIRVNKEKEIMTV